MRRPVLIVLLALAAAGCSSGSESPAEEGAGPAQDTTPTVSSRIYTKDELPKVALQPADAPSGMRYTKVDSGPRTPFDVGLILDEQVAEVRGFGLRGIFDVTFDSTTSDIRLTSRLWLFSEPSGAEGWLEKSRLEAELYQFQPITAPQLGDGRSWAARGNVGAEVISHAFRIGNLVVVTAYSTQSQQLSESLALAAAQKAAARVREL
ncbi:MAG: hypothetical protein WD689_10025 [Gaiellaceae bacterium]